MAPIGDLSLVAIFIIGFALNMHVNVRLNRLPSFPWIFVPNSALYCHGDDYVHPFLKTRHLNITHNCFAQQNTIHDSAYVMDDSYFWNRSRNELSGLFISF